MINYYKMILEYDGTDFSGWQVQPDRRTVQGEIESVLRKFLREEIRLTSAGRTDAGVHASGQVAGFATKNMMTDREIACKLDRMLPSDISLVSLEKAPDGFHARHDAVYRYYVYRILRKRSSLKDRFTWFCHYKLDIEEMKRICEKLTGLHYFRAFSKKMDDEEGYFCRMMKTECIPCAKGEEIQLHFKADRFLYGMVRMLTAAIVDVGRGKMTSETFLTALDTGIRPNMSVSVPAKGLIFREVGLRIF